MGIEISALILCGGQSRRFGSDKALYEVDGRMMIERVYEAVAVVASEVLVGAGDAGRAYPVPARHVADKVTDCGPLGGLHAGLLAADAEWVLVVAVDLPYITPASLRTLVAACSADVDAVVARAEGRVQPLCACYRTALAGRIQERLEAGQRAVMAFLDTIRVEFVDLPAAELRNVNRPPSS